MLLPRPAASASPLPFLPTFKVDLPIKAKATAGNRAKRKSCRTAICVGALWMVPVGCGVCRGAEEADENRILEGRARVRCPNNHTTPTRWGSRGNMGWLVGSPEAGPCQRQRERLGSGWVGVGHGLPRGRIQKQQHAKSRQERESVGNLVLSRSSSTRGHTNLGGAQPQQPGRGWTALPLALLPPRHGAPPAATTKGGRGSCPFLSPSSSLSPY